MGVVSISNGLARARARARRIQRFRITCREAGEWDGLEQCLNILEVRPVEILAAATVEAPAGGVVVDLDEREFDALLGRRLKLRFEVVTLRAAPDVEEEEDDGEEDDEEPGELTVPLDPWPQPGSDPEEEPFNEWTSRD